MFDIISVGNLSIDSIFLPYRETPTVILGGSSTYVSLVARRLEERVAIVSKVGNDFPEAYKWWLEQEGVDLRGISKTGDPDTTRFELIYSEDLTDRILLLKNRTPPITVSDLPNPMKALAIHIAPIAGEITYELIEKLKGCSDVLSLDPQGLIRDFDERGNVVHVPLSDERILNLVDIYKSSLEEIEATTGLSEPKKAARAIHDHGVKIVIVTLGSEGALLSFEDDFYTIPPCKPTRIVDPTGSGDAFIGGFLSEYVDGENVLRCACVGAAAASFAIEGVGPTSLGDKAQIYQRAFELYEKEIKQ